MNQIKLKAWSVGLERMISFHELIAKPALLRAVIGGESNITVGLSPMFIPLLFSGLLDKNESEVYSGDIVKAYLPGTGGLPIEIIGIVSFTEGSFNLMRVNQEPITLREIIKTSNGLGQGIEIIGNVHQTPELLRHTI